MAAWPTELPAPLINTLTESPPNNVIRSSMEVGPAKVRRRTTADIRPLSFSMLLSNDQVQILDDFFLDDVFSGADDFDFVHPRTGQTVKARFTQPPQYTEKEGVCYGATIALEILP